MACYFLYLTIQARFFPDTKILTLRMSTMPRQSVDIENAATRKTIMVVTDTCLHRGGSGLDVKIAFSTTYDENNIYYI